MMKRFEKSGKIIGLLLVAFGLAFAGCTPPGGGSSEGTATSQTDYATVPITIGEEVLADGSMSITIGEDGSGLTQDMGGHVVEVVNGSTSTSGTNGFCYANDGLGTGNVSCWIKLINRSATHFMTNAFITATKCDTCTTAVLDNPDVSHGVLTKVIGGPDVSVEVNGVKYCYAEDGTFVGQPSPFNVNGCDTYDVYTGFEKPYQTLHPECGQRVSVWDFGNQPTKFGFVGAVEGQFTPWNIADNPAFDFQDRSTWYVILADLAVATTKADYREGSWKRSNILAGWSPTGAAPNGAHLNKGTYFGINIAYDMPDRIESQFMGVPDKGLGLFTANNPNGYEYVWFHAGTIRYNPTVVKAVQVVVKGKVATPGHLYPCVVASNPCQTAGREAYDHLNAISAGGNSILGNGYIVTYRSLANEFKYYSTAAAYKTDNGGLIGMTAFNYVMKEAGHKGIAHLNRAFVGGAITWGNNGDYTAAAPNHAMTQEGPDSDPENTTNLYHFWVIGDSGEGSDLSVVSFSSFSQFMFAETSSTLVPGGTLGPPSDDWTDYCYPFDLGFPRYCDPGKAMADYVVFQGVELANPAILQSGEAVPGENGGIQGWNVYICVN